MRQAGKDGLAGYVLTGRIHVGLEVAKENGVKIGVEEGVAAIEGVREEPERTPFARQGNVAAKGPNRAVDHLHGDGVDHLLVEARVRLALRQASLHEQRALVEVDARVKPLVPSIVVVDLNQLAARTRLEVDLVGDLNRYPIGSAPAAHRIGRVDAQAPLLRVARGVVALIALHDSTPELMGSYPKPDRQEAATKRRLRVQRRHLAGPFSASEADISAGAAGLLRVAWASSAFPCTGE